MTLKKFNADFTSASQKIAAGGVPGVTSIAKGDSEGEVVISYRHDSLPGEVQVQALSQCVDEYPDGTTFMLFTNDEEAPAPVLDQIKSIQDYLFGMRLYEMVTELSSHFQQALKNQTVAKPGAGPAHSQDGAEEADEDDDGFDSFDQGDDDDDDDDDGYLDDEAFGLPTSKPTARHFSFLPSKEQVKTRQRLRRDLRQAKQAGYKVGLLDDLRHSGIQGIVSISIRAQKLGLSNEALEAWDVDSDDYIVLLIRVDKYTPLETVLEQPSTFTRANFRLGKCKQYKPSYSQALCAFLDTKDQELEGKPAVETVKPEEGAEFRKLFVSNSLDQYMNECFISLLKLRAGGASSWDAANNKLLDSTVLMGGSKETAPQDAPNLSSNDDPMDIDPAPGDHRILANDYMSQPTPEHGGSFPLFAMGFAMHYFVRCTEYCLRCHRRLDKGFEALRPYVCSKPLCLFQYMAMGFGPSIEHEILTEPYVVDLLVSLCYAAILPVVNHRATYGSDPGRPNVSLPIRDLPVGLHVQVPSLDDPDKVPLKVHLRCNNTRLVLDVEPTQAMDDRLRPFVWIAFRPPGLYVTRHAIVTEIDSSNMSCSIKIMRESGTTWVPSVYGFEGGPALTLPVTLNSELVDVYFYDTDLDSLSYLHKGAAIRHILETLPPIPEIAAFLRGRVNASLKSMEGISRTAASLLSWIVSSNRSCIFQIGSASELDKEGGTPSHHGKRRDHERIPGMDGWFQFRFAQGSPDKELRFKRGLQEVAARKSIEANPTIFAWHGSNLSNWHSIVRSGLDYNEVKNGRAFGNGVYFSAHHHTSVGYTHGGGLGWGNSTLKVSTCMSLNEIINVPDEWVSRTPHYVVSQNDWHQTRYLFVKALACSQSQMGTGTRGMGTRGMGALTANPATLASATARKTAEQGAPIAQKMGPQQYHTQAAGFQIHGPNNQVLEIPLAAIPFRHVGTGLDTPSTALKRTSIVREEDESAEEDAGDVEFLFSDDETDDPLPPPLKKTVSPFIPGEDLPATGLPHNRPLTPANTDQIIISDFEPGALDVSGLTTLAPPTFANDFATKALAREMKKLQDVQSKTPLHELGWYIDFDKITNLFQWIVELHSFDASLALAQDMKKVGVKSIVFEIRFGKDYPMSPPFVRVIRPRFLPFMEGGGGHVTAGGAMCMELLTNSGWSPANSMESVLLQVRMALCALEPKPGRLNGAVKGMAQQGMGFGTSDYRVGEAIDAYIRAANSHGWQVPADLAQTANGV